MVTFSSVSSSSSARITPVVVVTTHLFLISDVCFWELKGVENYAIKSDHKQNVDNGH